MDNGSDFYSDNHYLCSGMGFNQNFADNSSVVHERKEYPFPSGEDMKKGTEYAVKHFFRK